MSDRFNNFIPFILSHECVYAKGHYGDLQYIVCENVPGDSGGTTYAGIDKASHPSFDFKHPTLEDAKAVYLSEWDKHDCEHYPYPLGECFFNCAVNCGIGRALKILAKAKDGNSFIEAQEDFYKALVSARPSLGKFLRGWLNRTKDLRTFLKI